MEIISIVTLSTMNRQVSCRIRPQWSRLVRFRCFSKVVYRLRVIFPVDSGKNRCDRWLSVRPTSRQVRLPYSSSYTVVKRYRKVLFN